MKDPVFIIGGSRTGSNMLRLILQSGTDLNFVDEPLLFAPRWLHTDFVTNTRRHVGKVSDDASIDDLIELMYSKTLNGWCWQEIDRVVDKEVLRAELLKSDRSLREIFLVILEQHASARGRSTPGAKFPMHYSHSEKLFEWYPGCKVIHTTRDPRAVYASQAAKHMSNQHSAFRNNLTGLIHLAHISIQTIWTAKIHNKLQQYPNYYLSRYEDILIKPEKSITAICEFLGIAFSGEMLVPRQLNSSYHSLEQRTGIGFNVSSLDAWKTNIRPATAKLLYVLNRAAIRTFGYSQSA